MNFECILEFSALGKEKQPVLFFRTFFFFCFSLADWVFFFLRLTMVYLKKGSLSLFFLFIGYSLRSGKKNIHPFLYLPNIEVENSFIVVSSRVSGLEAFSHNLPNRW